MSVLTPEFAQKFIQKTVKNLPYNVNIMDQAGIIIASKDPNRIGNFHEVASKMLTGNLDTGIVTNRDSYIGTKPGINMFIEFRGENVGVICVSGDPESVQSFAGFVKSSIETMLIYEVKAANEQRSRGKAERFLHYILFDDDFQGPVAIRMAEAFNLKDQELGLIIIVRSVHPVSRSQLLPALCRGANASQDRIVVEGRNDDFIILKLLKGEKKDLAVRNFRSLVEEYIHSVIDFLGDSIDTDSLSFSVGSLQESIGNYRLSYNHALSNSMLVRKRQQINYFYDHVRDYLRSSVTTRLYSEAFSAFHHLFEEPEKKVVVETIRALMDNNFNIVKASQEIPVHRNTIIFRVNKLKDMLNIDPFSNSMDREFLTELSYFLEKS